MKYCVLAVALLVFSTNNAWADSDGYGCHGSGIVVWETAFEDRRGLFYLLFDNQSGISEIQRVELPRDHGSYMQGIECDRDRISILLRDKIIPSEHARKYLMFVTDISVSPNQLPRVISDKPDHYQVWKNYTDKTQEPLVKGASAALLSEPNFRLDGCEQAEDIVLDSDGESARFVLNFEYSNTFKPYAEGGGDSTTRCLTTVEMWDADEQLINSVVVADRSTTKSIY